VKEQNNKFEISEFEFKNKYLLKFRFDSLFIIFSTVSYIGFITYSALAAFPIFAATSCAAVDSARLCSWAAMASAGNVNAAVALMQLLRRFRKMWAVVVVAAALLEAAAAVAYDSGVVHYPPALVRADIQAWAYKNAMCHWRLSVNLKEMN